MSTGAAQAPAAYTRGAPTAMRNEHHTRGRPSVARVVVLAVVLGLAAGLGEVTLLGIAKFGLGRFTHLNPQIAWMAPLFYALLFGTLGAAIAFARPRASTESTVRAIALVCFFLGGAGILFTYQRLHQAAALVLSLGVAVQLSSMLATRSALALRWAGRALPVLAAIVLLLFAGLNGRYALAERRALAALPAPSEHAPNVLLIIWDTVRGENLSLYGYPRRTTPTLERLADSSIVFDAAFSTAPWTTPSHASMFTGLVADEHGADWRTPLLPTRRTLAEALASHGYRTGGFTANTYATARESGLDRGFARYVDFPVFSAGQFLRSTSLLRAVVDREEWYATLGFEHLIGYKPAPVVEASFLEWLDADRERPYFAFLNLFDAHSPYVPPAPFDTAFGPRLPGRDPHLVPDRRLSPTEVRAEIDAYDGSIAYLDHRLAVLLDTLRARGRLDNTIVIVTSDHGEEFGEHGVFTHGHSLYDPLLRVPLIIAYPGRIAGGVRVERMVSTRDLPATVLDLAGAADSLPGRSLLRHVAADSTPSATDTLMAAVSKASGNPSHYPVTRGDMWTAIADPLKLIVNGDGQRELYDLRADRAERRDLATLPEYAAPRSRLDSALARRAHQPLPPAP